MPSEVLVALLGLCGTLAGSFLGVMASQKLTNFRLQALEKKVDKHNNLIERTYKIEGEITEIKHDIKELKGYHKPHN
ncbi:MAG: hypothetical protein IJO56_05950 [Oscillospiraceae bacterium]|nr:hypothetical protein [Oscillospiraceae bacterium]